MKIVWKPVHQNDARFIARILSGINAMLIPPDSVLYEVHGQFPKPLCFDVRKSKRLCSTLFTLLALSECEGSLEGLA